jgi:hypothetical protein
MSWLICLKSNDGLSELRDRASVGQYARNLVLGSQSRLLGHRLANMLVIVSIGCPSRLWGTRIWGYTVLLASQHRHIRATEVSRVAFASRTWICYIYAVLLASRHRVGISAFKEAVWVGVSIRTRFARVDVRPDFPTCVPKTNVGGGTRVCLIYAVLLASRHRVGISAFKEASRVASINGSLIVAIRTWVCFIYAVLPASRHRVGISAFKEAWRVGALIRTRFARVDVCPDFPTCVPKTNVVGGTRLCLIYAVLLASRHRVGISAFKEASRVASIKGSLIVAIRTWVCFIYAVLSASRHRVGISAFKEVWRVGAWIRTRFARVDVRPDFPTCVPMTNVGGD